MGNGGIMEGGTVARWRRVTVTAAHHRDGGTIAMGGGGAMDGGGASLSLSVYCVELLGADGCGLLKD